MSKSKPKKDTEAMRESYDFSGGKRGKYAQRYEKGSNVVVLDPDVAELYPDAQAVNRVLRTIAQIAPPRKAAESE
jgi:hypothetical protein